MPKLASVRFVKTSDTNEKVDFESDVRVDSEGTFYFSVPDAIYDHAREAAKEIEDLRKMAVWIGGRLPGSRQTGMNLIRGRSLADVKRYIEIVIVDYLKVETSEEHVLAYRYASGLRFWVNPDGTIAPNGAIGNGKGEWVKDGDAHRGHYHEKDSGLSFGACALVRKTHRRGSREVVELELFRADNRLAEKDDPRALLNAFNQVEFSDGDERWRIIPYDPAAARFFYRTIEAICRVDLQLSTFFAKPKAVDKAIASGILPQLQG